MRRRVGIEEEAPLLQVAGPVIQPIGGDFLHEVARAANASRSIANLARPYREAVEALLVPDHPEVIEVERDDGDCLIERRTFPHEDISKATGELLRLRTVSSGVLRRMARHSTEYRNARLVALGTSPEFSLGGSGAIMWRAGLHASVDAKGIRIRDLTRLARNIDLLVGPLLLVAQSFPNHGHDPALTAGSRRLVNTLTSTNRFEDLNTRALAGFDDSHRFEIRMMDPLVSLTDIRCVAAMARALVDGVCIAHASGARQSDVIVSVEDVSTGQLPRDRVKTTFDSFLERYGKLLRSNGDLEHVASRLNWVAAHGSEADALNRALAARVGQATIIDSLAQATTVGQRQDLVLAKAPIQRATRDIRGNGEPGDGPTHRDGPGGVRPPHGDRDPRTPPAGAALDPSRVSDGPPSGRLLASPPRMPGAGPDQSRRNRPDGLNVSAAAPKGRQSSVIAPEVAAEPPNATPPATITNAPATLAVPGQPSDPRIKVPPATGGADSPQPVQGPKQPTTPSAETTRVRDVPESPGHSGPPVGPAGPTP